MFLFSNKKNIFYRHYTCNLSGGLVLKREYGKCSKILITSVFLFSNEMLVTRAGIHKMLVRIAQLVVLDSGFCLFVALRPKSTAMVIGGRSVHLATLFPGQA